MQIERYRQMTCEMRLLVGCKLTDQWLKQLRTEIPEEFPDASQVVLTKVLRDRIEMQKEGYEQVLRDKSAS